MRFAKRIRADSTPALPLGEAAVAKARGAREVGANPAARERHEHWGHTQSVSTVAALLPPVPVSARASQLAWLRASEKGAGRRRVLDGGARTDGRIVFVWGFVGDDMYCSREIEHA